MLTVMTFNGWLFLAIIIGMGLGYFLFQVVILKGRHTGINKINSQTCMVTHDNERSRDSQISTHGQMMAISVIT